MSRYQQAPYSDTGYDNQPSYGNGGGGGQGGNNYGGYSDEPSGGYGNGGHANNYASGGGGGNSYPMSSSNPYAASGSPRGYPQKKKRNKWLWIGIPLLLLLILGAVLGGVLGTQLHKKTTSSASSGSNAASGNTGVPSGVSGVNSGAATATGANGQVYLAIATDTYMLPVYATGTATSGYTAPTVLATPNAADSWPADPSPPSNGSIRANPRLIAPAYKWNALTSGLIANDPYFKSWNATIVANASAQYDEEPEQYTLDGGLSGSGVLDVARRIKLKVKNWAYAYHVTNETRYADRVFLELQTAAGNNTNVAFGADDGTRWNPQHFLDVAEFSSAFAIGYDMLYDFWTDEQKDAIMWSILNLGLTLGHAALSGASSASGYYWWTGNPTEINGNWNCVCNGGLTMAALAIIDRDPTGLAQQTLDLAVPNAKANCFQGAHSDGTWSETANYWYFGTTGAAEMVSALITAYGDDRGLSTSNPGWANTSLFHMYSQGMTSLFNYGDHGPNKYSATANSLLLWSTVFNDPRYALYQRDHYDASEPWSMFWYNPATSGTWWDGLALDMHFPDKLGEWATGRSTWTDNSGMYWAMKGGSLVNHQTHGDVDLGDFVLDAQGQRWFGELGSGQYLSDGYFSSEVQNSERYLYYRKRTEGQNTILINYQNQEVTDIPNSTFGSTGTSQGPAPFVNVSTDDTAFFTLDLSQAYNYTVKRGIRFLNSRRQVLIQDDITGVPTGTDVQWRAHTNATIAVSSNGTQATLSLNGSTLIASILSGPSGSVFTSADPTRAAADPPVPTGSQYDGDLPNPGVSVLVVDNPNGGDYSLQILLNPQWSGMDASAFVSPPGVAIDSWSLTSHNG